MLFAPARNTKPGAITYDDGSPTIVIAVQNLDGKSSSMHAVNVYSLSMMKFVNTVYLSSYSMLFI